MPKEYPKVIIVVGRYRAIEVEEGVYRLQYKGKFSFIDFIRRQSQWRTICVRFTNKNRLKVCLFHYANKNKIY